MNLLASETSPYLLQHAENPVWWHAWNKDSLEKAKTENKLILVSIGYSTCHWCHVMEEECFEDEEVADLMNNHFINIKVDREEHPDVDMLYMNALQLMTGRGGWPLNVICLPDGRPVWGATYLPKKKWMGVLHQLKDLFAENPANMEDYAEKLEKGIIETQTYFGNSESEKSSVDFEEVIENYSKSFDWENGGFKGSPKFMMPVNLNFLLQYGHLKNDSEILKFIEFTLTKMAWGGIYDKLSGGFSRYSVDEKLHIPHFEKMLYDNALLVELYSKAYLKFKNPLFKQVVEETTRFTKRELTSKEGYFYSALDADSINEAGKKEEGAFYVFSSEEIKETLQEDFEVFSAYYNIQSSFEWEGNYVLHQTENHEKIAEKFGFTSEELKNLINTSKEKLFKYQQNRKKPSLDDKCITSWNALMIKALVSAHKSFDEENYLQKALNAAEFIKKNLYSEEEGLFRNFKENRKNKASLEDYAIIIDALIELYQVTFDTEHLLFAKKLCQETIEKFYDKRRNFFYFSNEEAQLIHRGFETRDNVLPSSNSVMAKNLLILSRYFLKHEWEEISEKMQSQISSSFEKYPEAYGNWLSTFQLKNQVFYEVVITGKETKAELKKFQQYYLPDVIFAESDEKIPLSELKNSTQTQFFVCKKAACLAPTKKFTEALKQVQSEF